MNPCDHIRTKLSAYQDDEVGPSQKAAIEAHLRTCEDCRKHYETLQQAYRLLKREPNIEADENLPFKILDRISQSHQPVWTRGKNSFLRRLPVPAAAMALAFSGVLLGMLVGNFWIEQQVHSKRPLSAIQSNPALIIAAEKAFDATPTGSFSEAYLQLATYSPEIQHAN